jgi:zinc protease
MTASRSITFSCAVLLLAAASSAGGDEPKQPAPPAEGSMPSTTIDQGSGISETTFPNGLRLLVAPRPDDPMVACMIWYGVGSRDEDVGETGLSHYLEHMLFKGTNKYPKGEIDRVTQRNGGANNASTRYDCTEYHFSFPADRWEAALEIEADRMRGSNCRQEEFDAEKNVVLQELHHGLDDPEDVLSEAVGSAAFRVNGYHHPVIGWPEDVETTTRDRMMKYYLKHYTPDRATIVIVGGVDRAAVISKVGALFSGIARGAVERHEAVEPPSLGETRLTLYQDTQVPRLLMAYRSTSIRDEREPLLDVVAALLTGDKSTRLEKRLVSTGIAAAVECYSDTRRDDGLFQIQVEPTAGHDLDECEAAVREVLAGLGKSGPTDAELSLARAKILAGQVFANESAMGLASRLGSLAVVTDWRYHLTYSAKVGGATSAAVRDVAKAVFDPSRVVVGRSLPKPEAEGGGGGGGGAHRSPRRAVEVGDKSVRGARWRDDAGAGTDGAALAIRHALELNPTRTVLENGLTVLALRRPSVPLTYASLAVRDGRLAEDVAGLDAVVADLLMEGTTKRSGEDLAAAIGAVGGTLGTAGSTTAAKVMSKDAALGLSLVAEVAMQPAFAADAIERVKARAMQAIDDELDTPQAIARHTFDAAVYGEKHPLGRSVHGTHESVGSITRERVVAHHAKVFVPKNACLTIVSDRDPAEVTAMAREAFQAWKGGEPPVLVLPAPPKPAARKITLATDKKQTNTFVGHLGVTRKDPDYVALEVMDNVFGTGSGFTDRLSQNIRDQRGLAYTVYGNVSGNAGRVEGTFRMFAGTQPEHAAQALEQMHAELARLFAEPPSALEMEGAKAALRGGLIGRLEAASDVASVLDLCERFGLGFDYPARYLAEVSKTTAEDVVRVAKAHLFPSALVEVVVGPSGPSAKDGEKDANGK